MATIQFKDLSVQIGAQYMYVHQGNCQHRIVFTDMRLMHDKDVKNRNAYPVHVFQGKIKRVKCSVCDIYPAKYKFIFWLIYIGT
jgi:snRNA-activating protein complex subunit 3